MPVIRVSVYPMPIYKNNAILKLNVYDEDDKLMLHGINMEAQYGEMFSRWLNGHKPLGIEFLGHKGAVSVAYEVSDAEMSFLHLLKDKPPQAWIKLIALAMDKGADYVLVSEMMRMARAGR
ncbi:MAG: hypothetical protein QXE23_08665 [Nitrososphaerota archaeon]